MTAEAPADGYIPTRRAIEALRSGVPNRDAVRALGCSQPEIEEAFRAQLFATTEGVATETQAPGILVAGEFGSGKSHLLEYLMHTALEQNFVCSKIVISKETLLGEPSKLYRAAIGGAVLPGKKGAALVEVSTGLRFDSEAYADFYKWVNHPDINLNSRFPATVFLYQREKDPEVLDRIIFFWSGDPLGPVGPVKKLLNSHGEAGSYRLETVAAQDLWLQRFRFAARLMVAAGYRGWVLLVDEVELVARFSFKQRAKSYAALARWTARLEGQDCPGLATTFAIAGTFANDVLEVRNDMEVVPGKLRASGLEPDRDLATQAERGMRIINGRDPAVKPLHLRPPDSATIDQTQHQIQGLYSRAYNWDPPDLTGGKRLTSTVMRQHVRWWINEWDLKRLYPDYDPHMVVEELKLDYSEDHELEVPSESATDEAKLD